MLNKKIMVLVILAVALLTVSAASAAENATDDAIGKDLTSDMPDNPKTFADLNRTINGNDDVDVYLDANYTFSADSDSGFIEGVAVGRAVTVHGNGFTIDAANSARIFNVSNSNVVFRGIVFVNSNVAGGGGAINGECTAVNCTFVNNSVSDNDGGLSFDGGAMYRGFAVNCNFEGNSAYWGGAMYRGSAVNCSFVGNNANVGGAIYKGSAVNCSFVGNNANVGGAMYRGSAVNCSFIRNSAYVGGAIRIDYIDSNSIPVVNCSFVNCSASSSGGAVYCTVSNGVLYGCSFVNCSAGDYGGGIYCSGTNCSLVYPFFKGNNAKEGSDWYSVNYLKVIDRISTVIMGSGVNTFYGSSENLVITLNDIDNNPLAGERITISLNDEHYNKTTDSKGQVSLPIPNNLAPKNYAANVSYAGNTKYNPSVASVNIAVGKMDVILTAPDVVAIYNVSSEAVVTLKDAFGNVISGVKVKVVAGGLSKIARTDANGQVSLDISSLGPGEYRIAARSAVTDLYNEAKANANARIYADKLDAALTIPDVLTIVGGGTSVVATLKDESGNIISGVNVKVVAGNISKIARTDANGQVFMDISSLGPGEYRIAARSAVTDLYNEAKAYAKAIIFEDKFGTALMIPDVVLLDNASGTVVATLEDEYGNIVSGVKVKIVVGSLSRIARTDANGQVSIDISSLEIGEYKISARSAVTDIYNEAKTTAKATIVDKFNATLTIPDVVVVNSSGASVVATLKDVCGNVISGVKVKIVVGNLSKIARTDEKGQMSLDISGLAPGGYKISARSAITGIYNEAKVTAKAYVYAEKVTPALSIPDVEVQQGTSGAAAVATLKDANGNAISGVKVKIVAGTLSKIARTDANGQISIDISSLAPGQYKISARSAITDIYDEAKAYAKATIYAN